MLKKVKDLLTWMSVPMPLRTEFGWGARRNVDLREFEATVAKARAKYQLTPDLESEVRASKVEFVGAGPRVQLSYARVVAARTEALRVHSHLDTTIWLFRDDLYVTQYKLEPVEATALLLEAENKVKARVARARALMEQVEVIEGPGRPPIPDDVKVLVWQRDKGRCVKCGSNLNLEFDHIIPVSMGGANTFRNLQLLCEGCNRGKGGSLV